MTDPARIRFVVLLDANVLAKPVTRTLIMAAGARSGYGVTWSQYEEAEADRHARFGQTTVPELSTAFPFNSEAQEFVARSSDRVALHRLAALMVPYARNPDFVRRLIDDAETVGFEFDD